MNRDTKITLAHSNTGITIDQNIVDSIFKYYKLISDEDVIKIMGREEWRFNGRNDFIQVSKVKPGQDVKKYNKILAELKEYGLMISTKMTKVRKEYFTRNIVLIQSMNTLAAELLSKLYPDKKIENADVEMFELLKLFTGTHLDIINGLKGGALFVEQIRKTISKEYFHTSDKIGELVSANIIERTKGQVEDYFGDLKDNNRNHFYKLNDSFVRQVSDYLNNAVVILSKYRVPETDK